MGNEESMPSATNGAIEPGAPYPPPPPRYDSGMGSISKGPKRFPWGYAIAALVVVLVAFGAILLSGGTRVTIDPLVTPVSVTGDFSATASAGDLPYEVVTVEKTGAKDVKAEGTVQANDPAQGTVTIYNSQDKVQELIKNTRFETPDGLIFRIRDSLKVPPGTAEAPGTLTATVYADAGGATYNIGPSTFTLPGLKGSALYDKVYAKSTAAMTGGFSGERPSVGQATHDAAVPSIRDGLTKVLEDAVKAEVPEGYVLLPGTVTYSYADLPDSSSGADTVSVQVKGVATAYVFPKNALAKAIAGQTIAAYAGQEVTLRTADTLTFTPAEGQAATEDSGDTLTFNLSGTADIIWVVDEQKIAGAIAGKTRDAARTLLSGYPEVDQATLVVRPFWDGSLPSDPSKIEVVVSVPNEKK